jgi:hypothetical protein
MFIVCKARRQEDTDYLRLGTFVVLTLTLVALSIYTYDTRLMSKVAQEQWKKSSVLNATYSMEAVGSAGSSGRTLFRIYNPSTLVIRSKVRCNFRVYGDLVECHNDFNGINTWYVFPQQRGQGWFEIATLLAKKGKTCQQMVIEASEGNRYEQLTMDLEIEFRDELGNERRLPSRKYFFNFQQWRWVPHLTKQDDWV